MKKILNFYFPCIEDGGLEKNVFALVNSLAEKEYKINFFTYKDDTKNKKLKNKKGYLDFPCKQYPKSYALKHWQLGKSWLISSYYTDKGDEFITEISS